MKKYILLKDTMTKCGIVRKGTEVVCDNNCNSYESYTSNREFKVWFNKDVVENSPEWFKEFEDAYFNCVVRKENIHVQLESKYDVSIHIRCNVPIDEFFDEKLIYNIKDILHHFFNPKVFTE